MTRPRQLQRPTIHDLRIGQELELSVQATQVHLVNRRDLLARMNLPVFMSY